MDPAHVKAVRALDITFAHQYAREQGHPIQDGTSEITGAAMDADEVALMTLHKIRIRVGSESEAKASKDWLRARGLTGLFGKPLDDN